MRLLPSTWLLLLARTLAQPDYSQYVDVFFGTTNGGNMFPGVVPAPYAAVKLGPDTGGPGARSGFDPSGNISGFSLMHESGTGGSPKYGTVSQLPVIGNIPNPLARPYPSRAAPDNGTIGYYKTKLSNGITVELAGTDHVGFYQYTFPTSGGSPGIIVDVSQFLTGEHALPGLVQQYTEGAIQTFADGHYEGSGTYQGGWNLAAPWTVHFCGRFNETPASAQTYSGDQTNAQVHDSTQLITTVQRVATIFRFKGPVITSRVGFSFISTQKACQFVDSEIPTSTALSDLVTTSKSKWNQQVLSKITTTENNSTLLSQLYTAMYGMHLLPSNRTGENPDSKWDKSTPYYDDFYTLWDLFRCTTPLYHILQPQMYEEMLRSLIGIFKTDGWMPDGRSSNFNGRSQGGSNADNVLADAYVKGVRGQVNWDDGYAALLKDAEVTPPNNHDPLAPDSSTKDGRSALPDWLQFGFITLRFSRSVSRAVEYSVNDFAVYQVAKGLGKTADAQKYLWRSRNWRNHFNPTTSSLNTSGFVVPRDPKTLQFVLQDPLKCGGCYWIDPYYEAKPWEYTLNAHHDLATLVAHDGTTANFVRRIDTFLDPKVGIADLGNEPAFATPYLYNFVNQQARSVQASRGVARNLYSTGPNGLPGNSDAGALQSWLLWNMIGLYPMTGQTTFLIGSPWFSNLTVDLGSGKSVQITSTTANGTDTTNVATTPAIYVQSLQVNGKPWTQNWLTWSDVFANGGTLHFVLGPNMTAWDAGAPLPPSPASAGNQTGANLPPVNAASGAVPGTVALQRSRYDDKWRKVAIGVGVAGGLLLAGLLAFALIWWFYYRPRSRRARAAVGGDGVDKTAQGAETESSAANEGGEGGSSRGEGGDDGGSGEHEAEGAAKMEA